MTDHDDEVEQALSGLSHGMHVASDAAELVTDIAHGDAAGAAHAASGAVGGATHLVSDLVDDAGARDALSIASRTAEVINGAIGLVEAGAELFEALAADGETPAEESIRYTFAPREVEGEWVVLRMSMREEMGRPYSMRVELLNEDRFAHPEELLGRDCTVTIARGARARSVHGIVHRVELGEENNRAQYVTAFVVPAVSTLGLRRDSRIFQNLSALEVIEAVLGAGLSDYDREVRNATQEQYPIRETITQYGETDLDFAHRLMEEEGISADFDHDGERETLVLTDRIESYRAVSVRDDRGATSERVRFSSQRGQVHGLETIHEFRLKRQMTPTSAATLDWDFTRHEALVSANVEGEDEIGRVREWFDHERALSITKYDEGSKAYQAHDAKRKSSLRLEDVTAEGALFEGAGVVTGLFAGAMFELTNHPNPDLDGRYVVLSVEHKGVGDASSFVHGDGGHDHGSREDADYENRFVCMRHKRPHRLGRRTKKPRIAGIQTALVVGPNDGTDDNTGTIHTDEHGRIRLQFPWDRYGTRDQNSSAWVRVAQAWAGHGHGSVFTPRVGSEVVVSFVDGDPDRPIVTGSLFNGRNPYLYEMPAKATVSGIKTQSVPHGDGYNELAFDDDPGNELVRIHAQRDHEETVEHDQRVTVHRNQRETVDGNQRMHVGGDRQKTIAGKEEIEVDGLRRATIRSDEFLYVQGARTEHVQHGVDVQVGGARASAIVGVEYRENQGGQWVKSFPPNTLADSSPAPRGLTVSDRLEVQGDKSDLVSGNYDIQADQRFKVTQGHSSATMESTIVLSSPNGIRFECGAAYIAIEEDGTIRISTPNKIVAQAGGNMVTIDNSRGSVEVVAQQTAGMTAGSSQVTAGPSGVDVAGQTVSVQGSTSAVIEGGTVNIN